MHNLGITKYIRGGYNAFSRTVLFDYWTCLLFYRLTGKSIRDHVKRLRDGSVRSVVQPARAKDVKENQSALHWVKWCSALKKPASPLQNIQSNKSYVVGNVIFRKFIFIGRNGSWISNEVTFAASTHFVSLSYLDPALFFPLIRLPNTEVPLR